MIHEFGGRANLAAVAPRAGEKDSPGYFSYHERARALANEFGAYAVITLEKSR
jgi:hypothetical protein